MQRGCQATLVRGSLVPHGFLQPATVRRHPPAAFVLHACDTFAPQQGGAPGRVSQGAAGLRELRNVRLSGGSFVPRSPAEEFGRRATLRRNAALPVPRRTRGVSATPNAGGVAQCCSARALHARNGGRRRASSPLG